MAGVVVGLVTVLGACGEPGGRPGDRVTEWLEVLDDEVRADPPRDDVMQLDPSASCRLVDDVSVSGDELELVGSALAQYGADQGVRYQCAWSGHEGSGRPANVRLEIVRLHGREEMRRYRDLVESRPHAHQVKAAGRVVEVAEVLPPPPGARTFDAEILLDDRFGAVRLLLELTDPALAESFEPQQVADLLVEQTGPASAS